MNRAVWMDHFPVNRLWRANVYMRSVSGQHHCGLTTFSFSWSLPSRHKDPHLSTFVSITWPSYSDIPSAMFNEKERLNSQVPSMCYTVQFENSQDCVHKTNVVVSLVHFPGSHFHFYYFNYCYLTCSSEERIQSTPSTCAWSKQRKPQGMSVFFPERF